MSLEHRRESAPASTSELVVVRPKSPISPVPILLAPGFANNADAYSGFMQEMAQRGRTMVCPEYNFQGRRRFGVLPDVNVIKQEALLSAVNQMGYQKEDGTPVVDAIAHSLGGIDLVLLAREHPENFRSIILLASNGMHPEMGIVDSLRRLYNGERADSIDKRTLAEKEPEVAAKIAKGREYSKAHRRKLVTIFPEIRRGSFQTVQQFFPELRMAGVKIVITRMESDSWFPPESYDPYVDLVDDTLTLEGIHGDIKFHPGKVAQELSEWFRLQNLVKSESDHTTDSNILW